MASIIPPKLSILLRVFSCIWFKKVLGWVKLKLNCSGELRVRYMGLGWNIGGVFFGKNLKSNVLL